MRERNRFIALPCDCGCCMFVVEKSVYEDGDIAYDISIQDSRYDHDCNTLWGRVKRAAKILFGKPVYYNDAYLEGEETYRKLLDEMIALRDWTPDVNAGSGPDKPEEVFLKP